MSCTEQRPAEYLALARALPNIGSVGMLGPRLNPGLPLEPLWERYYCWKYGAHDDATIHLDELCPFIYDLCQLRARQLGKPLAEVFHGTAYLVSPLKLERRATALRHRVQGHRRGPGPGAGGLN